MKEERKTGATLNRGGSKQDYETPDDFMTAVVGRFGKISCDLAATSKNTKCSKFITPEENSFTKDWSKIGGLLWLNPPFDNIKPWVQKCDIESRKGARILLLTPASIGSAWFAVYVHRLAYVMALTGRLTFKGCSTPYPKDCILSYYCNDMNGFDNWRWKSERR
jgi:phage N-6-adenine-methyltransferase